MVNLDVEDHQGLVNLLKDLPELASERSRLLILEGAGLKQLIPNIDISGNSYVAISGIVSYLSRYGRLTYDHEALGLFLNFIKNLVGVQQQEFLNALLVKYNMMTPIVTSPSINQWQGKEVTEDVLEKIIGESTLRSIAFLQQGLEVAKSVAYIGVQTAQTSWSGTGFLVSNDLLITNHHILPNSDLLAKTIFRFNYQEDYRGQAQTVEEYRSKANGSFHTSSLLDYTVVELDGKPGQRWGWIPMISVDVKYNNRVNIIQHPLGQPKQISLQNNFVEYVGGNVVQYVTSTLNGSSGSPVLNDCWELVALHHAGGNIPEPTTQRRYFRNEGILVEKILLDLPSNLKDLITKTAKS